MLAWLPVLATAILVFLFFRAVSERQPPPQSLRKAFSNSSADLPTFGRAPSNRRLTPEELDKFLRVWHSVWLRFQQDPKTAIVYADLMISDLMQHPPSDAAAHRHSGNQFLEDQLREKYRCAHRIASQAKRAAVAPEQLDQAMALYASVCHELVGSSGSDGVPVPSGCARARATTAVLGTNH